MAFWTRNSGWASATPSSSDNEPPPPPPPLSVIKSTEILRCLRRVLKTSRREGPREPCMNEGLLQYFHRLRKGKWTHSSSNNSLHNARSPRSSFRWKSLNCKKRTSCLIKEVVDYFFRSRDLKTTSLVALMGVSAYLL